jgi:hypothetical protein
VGALSNFTVTLSDGNTVPSTTLLGSKTYVDIGSGNVLKISWTTPTAQDNKVASYIVYVLAYNAASGTYTYVHKNNVGLVNEFYLKSSLLTAVEQTSYPLRVYVEAVSDHGSSYNRTSATLTTQISKGCGVYRRVEEGYSQPVFKRALAFAKLDYLALQGADDKALIGADGEPLFIKAAATQDTTTGWSLMQEFYTKDSNGYWKTSDIQYETLVDTNGEIVTDSSNSTVYML